MLLYVCNNRKFKENEVSKFQFRIVFNVLIVAMFAGNRSLAGEIYFWPIARIDEWEVNTVSDTMVEVREQLYP